MKWEGNIYELQSMQWRKYCSWFINQRVSSSKLFYVANRIDPRFLLLPFLEKASSNFSPISQILDSAGSTLASFKDNMKNWKLDEICDINDKFGEDMILYRLNFDKIMVWLKDKINRAAIVLSSQKRLKARTQNPLFANHFNHSVQSNIEIGESIDGNCDLVPLLLVDPQRPFRHECSRRA